MKLLSGRHVPLETRLTQFFILSELIWVSANALLSYVVKLPIAITYMYMVNMAWIAFLVLLQFATRSVKLCKTLFLTSLIFIIPIMWFFLGGTAGSANVLFVCEYIAFIMCLSGWKRNVYLIIAVISTPLSQNVSRNIKTPEWLTFDPRQQAICGSLLGISTSIVIIALLIKQKAEYAKERDAAIESEKALEVSNKALEQSNKMQKNFLANMSHEIRSPLGIVLGFNNLITDSNDLEHIHEYSKNIDNAGRTLRTVINDILDYSKIESGKLDIINENYSFRGMIEEIETDISLKADEKGLKFIVNIDDKIPSMLYGDNVRVRQCLLNILSNAVKYTDTGEIVFDIEAENFNESDTSCNVKYTVSDTGRGISEEAIPHLFDAFQRLDESQNRGIEGTGLGLAIVKSLLDEMNGTVDVTSTKNVGTTFTVQIEQDVAKVDERLAEIESGSFDFTGKKALVVDDTRLNLTLIAKFLGRLNMESETIDNGKGALERCNEEKYDVIFLDHMMPEMNGIEVFLELRKAKGINESTPVIMLTANAMAGVVQEYMDMGFDGYVSKPIDMNKLKLEIAKVLL